MINSFEDEMKAVPPGGIGTALWDEVLERRLEDVEERETRLAQREVRPSVHPSVHPSIN